MVRQFLTLSPAISRLNVFPRNSLLSILPSRRLQKDHHTQQKLVSPTLSLVSSSSPVRCFSSNGTRVPFLPSNEISKLDENLVVLGIETSCDDTAAAVVRSNGEILSQVVSSQAELLARYGGVAPKQAEEAHSEAIDKVVQEALDRANVTEKELSAVAVTIGPGLSLCLRVGVQKARRVAGSFRLPIVGVHHMEAHALVARLSERELTFPFMALLISGGHNLLVLAHGLGQYTQLGTTVDDAIGEAFDKTAKWLGLDMRRSGGPAVEELALEGDAESVKFNVPMKHHKDCNFSYAGLKTQVRLAIEAKGIDAKCPVSSATSEDRRHRADVAASFQRVAVLHLEEKCERAIEWALKIEPSIQHLVVSGGVASNQYVRARLSHVVEKRKLKLVCPPPSLCTDNGVMVAWTGLEHFRVGRYDPPPAADEPEDTVYDLRPRWPLGEEYAEGRSEARSVKRARIHPSLTSIIQASLLDNKHKAEDSVCN
ncbi:PREDICTED: probable tRNA N6-adenosine threonylcarbamoyltransferase, mitochondrial [Tarenaya hassleriana]|uniref:probable tRNA N6-adenosine threonylcarbamoyltransferase, mitochondrial n=1 Tax=Tarenaya hassleriana TaxID=28532 RepID=UPI00053C40A9|nr:PREDICTED: probable tRNA N6-adenosine threonylcarbamoyltransferase, mitochondrial [Tarenaya hassleriana]